jgi:hypothetical protein
MIRDYDYKTASFRRTFDCYDYVDCFNYMDLHDLLKLYKHGYSKVTDHACREIRFGRLSRDQGLALVRKHELAPLAYINQFCEWLGMTPRSLQFMIDQHRNPKFWHQIETNTWEFNGWSKQQPQSVNDEIEQLPQLFEANNHLEYGEDAEYITIGKGFP